MTTANHRNPRQVHAAANFTDFILATYTTSHLPVSWTANIDVLGPEFFDYGAGDLDKIYWKHIKEITQKSPPAEILEKYRAKLDPGAFFVASFQRYAVAQAFFQTVTALYNDYQELIMEHPGVPLAQLINLNLPGMFNSNDTPLHQVASLREWVEGYSGAQIMSLALRRTYPEEISHPIMCKICERFGAEIAGCFGKKHLPRENYAPNNIRRAMETLAAEIYQENKAGIIKYPHRPVSFRGRSGGNVRD